MSKCTDDFLFVDEYLFYFYQRFELSKYRIQIDWLFGIFLGVGLFVIICTVKRSFWKLNFIKINKTLIKDEDWKKIHMKIPRLIVILILIAVAIQGILILAILSKWIIMHKGYSNLIWIKTDNKCGKTVYGKLNSQLEQGLQSLI